MKTQPLAYDKLSKTASIIWLLIAYVFATWIFFLATVLFDKLGPLLAVLIADVAATLVIFAFSLGFDNTSVYDPYWSVAPLWIIITWMSKFGGAVTFRQGLVTSLILLWAVRLTVNCVQRWRGMGHEDWRYAGFRPLKAYWLVSLAGLQFMPTIIVLTACLPLLTVFRPGSTPLNWIDAVAFAVTSGAILLETLADRELRMASGKKGELITSGVWNWFRHPNYAGEVSFWWGLALFGMAAGSEFWALSGPVAMTLLFIFISVPMMDRRMKTRYKSYESHIESLPFHPFL